MFHEIYTITDLEVIAPYTRRLRFNDNSMKSINFCSMVRGELYGPCASLTFLIKFVLDTEAGTLVWPNEADFDSATLHDWDKVGDAMITMERSWSELPLFTKDETTETGKSIIAI